MFHPKCFSVWKIRSFLFKRIENKARKSAILKSEGEGGRRINEGKNSPSFLGGLELIEVIWGRGVGCSRKKNCLIKWSNRESINQTGDIFSSCCKSLKFLLPKNQRKINNSAQSSGPVLSWDHFPAPSIAFCFTFIYQFTWADDGLNFQLSFCIATRRL